MERPLVTVPGSPPRCAPEPRRAPLAVRVLCLLTMLGLAAWLGRFSVAQIRNVKPAPDFKYFYKAGEWLLAHGNLDPGYDVTDGRVQERDTLRWYLPFASRFMTLFALLPYRAAGYVWLAMNLAAMLATLWLVGRYLSGLQPRDWPVTQLLPLAFLAVYWRWEFQLNQINALTLLLVVGSFVCWERGRRVVSGLWLGLAILLKVTPALLVLWFVLKRQYRTAGAALVTVVLLGPAMDLVWLGPSATADAYRAWVRNAVTTGSHRGLILAQCEMDWRNQGLGAVLARWLHPTNYNTHFDNDPQVQRDYGEQEVRLMNVATLPRETIARLTMTVLGVASLGLLWLTRRPARELSLWQLRGEWALFMLAMLALMPVLRRYHMIWALPAVSLLAGAIHYSGLCSGWAKLALGCIGAAVVLQLTLLSHRAEAMGVLWASVLLLALPLVVLLVRLKRAPDALPQAHFAPGHPARAVLVADGDRGPPTASQAAHG